LKIALSCDHILERSQAITIVEMVGSLYEDAEIFTLVHRPGNVLGPIEQRKIRSTFLSHKVKDKEHFYQQSFLVPSAAKNLHIPCNFDLVINISSGFSQGIKRCESTKMISYFLPEEGYVRKSKKWWEFLFSPYLKQWAEKNLRESDLIWVPDEATKDILEDRIGNDVEIKVVYPFFNVDDFPLIPSSYWKHDFFAIDTAGLDSTLAGEMFDLVIKSGVRAIFVGEDDHLEKLKKVKGERNFFGHKCTGELAPFLASSRGLLSLREKGFPDLALKALSVGRPIVVKDSEIYREYLSGEGVSFLPHLAEKTILNTLEKVNSNYKNLDSKKIRAQVMKFSPQKFKGHLLRALNDFQ
jgi:glycosyltransferase involved in cell wall biosynthesis